MNFVSVSFWIYLLFFGGIIALMKLALRRRWQSKHDRAALLFLSIALFGLEDIASLLIFLGVAALIYACINIRAIREAPWRWTIPVVMLVATTPLFYFKYAGFLGLREENSTRFVELAIPIGLSFYTFQLLALFIDTRKLSLKEGTFQPVGPVHFLNFGTFFPQIVAGPIERQSDLMPQIKRFSFCLSSENLVAGVKLVILGLFYKLVVADGLAASGGWIQDDFRNPFLIHLSNLVFGLRIYGDFCGYSLIALGIGRALGVTLSLNFLSPYCRTNLREFWRNWHITLTKWLRDYIYIPLGGNKVFFASLATFLISGIWHGAGWNFIFWGALHGVGISLGFFAMYPSSWIGKMASWLLTMVFVFTAWLPFYQWEWTVLSSKLIALVSPSAYLESPWPLAVQVCDGLGGFFYLLVSIGLGLLVILLEFFSLRGVENPYQWGYGNVAQALMLFLIIVFAPAAQNSFIYFSF